MATYSVLNADGIKVYFEADGTGTALDPFVPRSADSTSILSALQSTLTVDGSAATQPVSAAALPLPSGAATLAAQNTANSALAAIQAAAEILDDIVSGSEAQVDIVGSLPAGTNAIGKLAANSGVDIGDVDVTSIAAGETYIGKVGTSDTVVTITASLDTSAYADGDVLFDTQEIALAARANGETLILHSVVVTDIDDQAGEFDLVFFDTNQSIGTENAAVSITAANLASEGIGNVSIVAGDYIDMVNAQQATKQGIGLVLKADSAATSLYVAGVSRDTKTYTASGLIITFGFLRS